MTRLKDNAVHTNMAKGVRAVDADGKWGDYQIQFTAKNALATGCVEYRVVQWYDEDCQRWFEFLTNDRELEPEEIAQLYRDRWQIELFFKKVKPEQAVILGRNYRFEKCRVLDDGRWVVRFCTAWSTRPEALEALIESVKHLEGEKEPQKLPSAAFSK